MYYERKPDWVGLLLHVLVIAALCLVSISGFLWLACTCRGAEPAAQVAPAYSWWPAGGEQWALFRGEVQLGIWDGSAYWPRLAPGRWGPECEPPVPVPECALAADRFGVRRERISAAPRITHNGHEVSQSEALRLVTEGVPDDRGLPRLTVIGPEASRKHVLDDLAASPTLAPYRGAYLVQGYDPGEPILAGLGFVTTGSPTIYVQSPDGKVLHRQDDYQGGAERLAVALRQADPSYDPKRDPDAAKPKSPFAPLGGAPTAVYALAGLGVALCVFGRKKKELTTP